MHEFNIKFFTEIGKENNLNGKTVGLKFFSGNSAIFYPEYPIREVYTTIPTPVHIAITLNNLGFVVNKVTNEVKWIKK